MKLFPFFLVLLSFSKAECPIECYCDRVTTCTGDKFLTHFPLLDYQTPLTSGLGLPIVRLELHDYTISHLSRTDFLLLISNLTEISISRNSLETFDNSTFSPTSTQPDFFLQLRILDLSQNKLLYFVGGGLLRKVKILDLSSNTLQQVYQLGSMLNLESVNLRDNHINSLHPSIFQNLRNLQYVNLDSNILARFDPTTFSNLPSLAHLILSNNPIGSVGFYWNSRVQFVDVSNTGLTSVPASLTKTVRDFRCANNNLSVIRQTDFESYPNVGLLVLDENAIELVEDDAFGRLDFLARLWINGNRLKTIPQNLAPSLRSLQLESNLISNLSVGDFKNLHSLEELNLHSNRIISIPPQIFADLTRLRSLDLRSNLIDVIYRDSFANLTRLETLDLSQNPIKVIVSKSFNSLQKLNLFHLSRLLDPVELDIKATFKALQSLQILELDDSPHITQKLFQDNAFSYMVDLIELNVQRCQLTDLNLVSNAVVDNLGDLRSLKMNGNPWDCEDLHGSAIHELMSKLLIVDQPVCATPPSLKNVQLSALNTSMSQSQQSLSVSLKPAPSSPPLTHSSGDSSLPPSTVVVTTDQNINSSGNGPSATEILRASPSSIPMTKPRLTISNNSFPSPNSSASKATQNRQPPQTTENSFDIDLGSSNEALPTQSYFDFSNNRDSGSESAREKQRTTSLETGTRAKSSEETKTNDDNAIIDERQRGKEQEQRSIDGFPLSYPDSRAKEDAPSASDTANPKYSYLKLQDNTRVLQTRANLPKDDTSATPHTSVIIKTLVISAFACLASILALFFVSFSVYKYTSQRRCATVAFPCTRRCSNDEDDDNHHPGRTMYTRFGRSKPRLPFSTSAHLHPESDSDQVELSGITNSLYFENEDIYHIT